MRLKARFTPRDGPALFTPTHRRAGRQANQFGVEVRCSGPTAEMMEQGAASELTRRWAAECSQWKAVQVLALEVSL